MLTFSSNKKETVSRFHLIERKQIDDDRINICLNKIKRCLVNSGKLTKQQEL